MLLATSIKPPKSKATVFLESTAVVNFLRRDDFMIVYESRKILGLPKIKGHTLLQGSTEKQTRKLEVCSTSHKKPVRSLPGVHVTMAYRYGHTNRNAVSR